jgi:AraC-like DNA-binding protein
MPKGDRTQQIAEPPVAAAEWRGIAFRLSEAMPVHGGYVVADPAPEPEYDMHYGVELGVVLRGRMRRLWRTWETELEPGQVWLCGMWERHGWQALTPGCRHLVFVLLPQFLLRARFQEAPDLDWMAPFTVQPQDRPSPQQPARREILALVRRAEPDLSTPNPQQAVTLELLALQLLLTALEDWKPPRRRPPTQPERRYDLVSAAVEIALGSRRALTTREVAHRLGMSPSTFARSFQGLMGISFTRFALRSRLGQAAAQLAHSRDSIEKVAADWGFPHVRHFQRRFKHHYGLAPAVYRERRG